MLSFFKQEIKLYQSNQENNKDINYPSIYPICLILSKLKQFAFVKKSKTSDPIKSIEKKQENDKECSSFNNNTKLKVSIILSEKDYEFFYENLLILLKNKNYLVRNLISKSLISVLPIKPTSSIIEDLFKRIEISTFYNEKNGLLSSIYYILCQFYGKIINDKTLARSDGEQNTEIKEEIKIISSLVKKSQKLIQNKSFMIKFEFLKIVNLLFDIISICDQDSFSSYKLIFSPIFNYVNHFVNKKISNDLLLNNFGDFSESEFLKLCIDIQFNLICKWGFHKDNISEKIKFSKFIFGLFSKIIIKSYEPSKSLKILILLEQYLKNIEKNIFIIRSFILENNLKDVLVQIESSIIDFIVFQSKNKTKKFGNGLYLDFSFNIIKNLLNESIFSKNIPDHFKALLDLDLLKNLYSQNKQNKDFVKSFFGILNSILFFEKNEIQKYEKMSFMIKIMKKHTNWDEIEPLRNAISSNLHSFCLNIKFLFEKDIDLFFEIIKIFLLFCQDESYTVRNDFCSSFLWIINNFWNLNEAIENSFDTRLKKKIQLNLNSSSEMKISKNILMQEMSIGLSFSVSLKFIFSWLFYIFQNWTKTSEKENYLSKFLIFIGDNIKNKYIRLNQKIYKEKQNDFFFLPDKLNQFNQQILEQELSLQFLTKIKENKLLDEKISLKAIQNINIMNEDLLKNIFYSDTEYLHEFIEKSKKSSDIQLNTEKNVFILNSKKFDEMFTH